MELEVAKTGIRSCQHCHEAQMRRINRVGLLQRYVLTYFGYFPWECVLCRRRVFLRDNGQKASQRATG